MARIRTIKPDFFFNEGLAALSAETRLFFIGLWCQADRDGRMEDRPGRLRASIFPYDSGMNADQLVDELANMGHLIRYEVDGVKVLQISNFLKHQRPHHTEPKSVLPPCPDRVKTVKTPSRHREAPLGREGKGKEGKGKDIAVAPAPAGEVVAEVVKPETPLQAVVACYKVCKGIARNDKGWDKANFSRYSRAASKLLDRFKGDKEKAIQYLCWRSTGLDEKGLEWTLDTVAKQAWDNVDLGGEHGLENGEVDADNAAGRLRPGGLARAGEVAGDTLRAIEASALRAEGPGELAAPPRIDEEGPGGEA